MAHAADSGAAGIRFFACVSRGGGQHLAIESTNNKAPRIRVNRQIRISPLRVIAPDGAQLGVMTVDEALAAAQERGLDLVEVAPLARPPVVKIMDHGKFKFEPAKASRASSKTWPRSSRIRSSKAATCRWCWRRNELIAPRVSAGRMQCPSRNPNARSASASS